MQFLFSVKIYSEQFLRSLSTLMNDYYDCNSRDIDLRLNIRLCNYRPRIDYSYGSRIRRNIIALNIIIMCSSHFYNPLTCTIALLQLKQILVEKAILLQSVFRKIRLAVSNALCVVRIANKVACSLKSELGFAHETDDKLYVAGETRKKYNISDVQKFRRKSYFYMYNITIILYFILTRFNDCSIDYCSIYV